MKEITKDKTQKKKESDPIRFSVQKQFHINFKKDYAKNIGEMCSDILKTLAKFSNEYPEEFAKAQELLGDFEKAIPGQIKMVDGKKMMWSEYSPGKFDWKIADKKKKVEEEAKPEHHAKSEEEKKPKHHAKVEEEKKPKAKEEDKEETKPKVDSIKKKKKEKTIRDLVGDEFGKDIETFSEKKMDSIVDWKNIKDGIKIELVDPDKVFASAWNELTEKEANKKAERFSKMDFDEMPPIVATLNSKTGRMEAINGIHRVFAGQIAKKKIPAIILDEDVFNKFSGAITDSQIEVYLINKLKDRIIPIENKKEKEPHWTDDYAKYNLNKLPRNMPEEKVTVNLTGDIDSHAVMSWRDPKSGKYQQAYTKKFLERNALNKWRRVEKLDTAKVTEIKDKCVEVLNDLKSKQRDAAAITLMIALSGLRPGERAAFKKTKNRGISTLAPENVKIDGDKISLDFTGKSFHQNVSEIHNATLADYLTNKLSIKKEGEFIFDVERQDVADFFQNDLGAKKFKLKDLRTYTACDMARNILFNDSEPPPPLPKKTSELKKLVQAKLKHVFEKVSQKLNNSPAMAKSSYVHPAIIDSWLISMGLQNIISKGESDEDDVDWSLDSIVASMSDLMKQTKDADLDEFDEEFCDEYNLPDWWSDELDNEEKKK